jgi:hypothetical protein
MKKVILGTVLLSSSAVQAMIVTVDNDTHISRPSETIVARSENQQLVLDGSTTDLSGRINFRQVRDPVRLGGRVRVSIRDFVDDGGQRIPVGRWYTRTYPLQKILLRYQHDIISGFSSPVQELFAMVTDIEYADRHGKMVVDPEYVDNETRILHQIRETGSYQMDDYKLRARPFTEIFMTTDGKSVIVDEAKIRDGTAFVKYTFIDRSEPVLRAGLVANYPKKRLRIACKSKISFLMPEMESGIIGDLETRADDTEFNYQRTETTERWRRPDTTIFTKRTEGMQKIAKPVSIAPVSPPHQTKKVPVYSHYERGSSFGGHWDDVKHVG